VKKIVLDEKYVCHRLSEEGTSPGSLTKSEPRMVSLMRGPAREMTMHDHP
jgi:hypothetical protein